MTDTPVYTQEDFIKGYKELCEKMGYRIFFYPALMSRDDGSFSIIQHHGVEKLPPKDTK